MDERVEVMFLCTVASISFEIMPFVSRYTCCVRTHAVAVRQDVLIFGKPENFMAEMQGPHALKQFMRKGAR